MKAEIGQTAHGPEVAFSMSDATMRWLFSVPSGRRLSAQHAAEDFAGAQIDPKVEAARHDFCRRHSLRATQSPLNGRWTFLREHIKKEHIKKEHIKKEHIKAVKRFGALLRHFPAHRRRL